MFERFTREAREIVVRAHDEARELGQRGIGTEHLLLAMFGAPDALPARVLASHRLDRVRALAAVAAAMRAGDPSPGGEGTPAGPGAGADELDAEALGSIGIDLDAVRERVEASFGPGALDLPGGRRGRIVGGRTPFDQRSRKVLELALREAIAMRSREIRSGHLLLGIVREGSGLAARVLRDAGIDLRALAEEVRAGLRAESGAAP